MRRVILESPYSADDKLELAENEKYLQRCIRDCIFRGDSPYASHQMLTDALDDDDAAERMAGIEAGLVWHRQAEASLVYIDRGITEGMREGIENAEENNLAIEYRSFEEHSGNGSTIIDPSDVQ